MGELRALLSREWILSRRWVLVLAALTTLGYAALYVLCQPEDRYRLLCDPALVRRVALIGALASGGSLAYRSFAHEIRSGTWEHMLMLPVARGTIVGVKFAFGAVALFALTALPVVALRTIVASSPVTGGPVLTLPELFVHSILGRAMLVGVTAYCAGAAAALSLRTHNRVFWAPLVAPALLFFVTNGDRSDDKVSFEMGVALLVIAALALLHAARETKEAGERPSEALKVLRVTSAAPLAMAALAFAGSLGVDAVRRNTRHERESYGAHDDQRAFGFGNDGRIGWHARSMGFGLHSLRPRDSQREPRSRYWTPDVVQRTTQYFLDHRRNVLLAYGLDSGRSLGCVGRDGPRERDCAEFSSRPSFVSGEIDFVLEPHRVAILDSRSRRIDTVFRGPVDRVAYMGSDEAIIVFQSSDKVVAVQRVERETSEEEPENAAVLSDSATVRTTELCRGVGRFGDVRQLAINDGYVAIISGRPASDEETYIVCRNGVVTESQSHRETRSMSAPERSLRDVVTATLMGPLGSMTLDIERHYVVHGDTLAARSLSRRPVWIAAVAAAIVLALARRRAHSVLATAATISVGPAFLLAWALVHARRAGASARRRS
ncbi:MAG: ABC transporter permease [Myxococcales bacterium]|nr:ABC transporter permease [Myxococcales bacterium]